MCVRLMCVAKARIAAEGIGVPNASTFHARCRTVSRALSMPCCVRPPRSPLSGGGAGGYLGCVLGPQPVPVQALPSITVWNICAGMGHTLCGHIEAPRLARPGVPVRDRTGTSYPLHIHASQASPPCLCNVVIQSHKHIRGVGGRLLTCHMIMLRPAKPGVHPGATHLLLQRRSQVGALVAQARHQHGPYAALGVPHARAALALVRVARVLCTAGGGEWPMAVGQKAQPRPQIGNHTAPA